MTSQHLKNKKIIIITGVSSGVGAAFAKLVSQKPDIFLIGVGRNDYEIEYSRGRYIKANLLIDSDINKVIKIIQKEIGRVDVLINNAGSGYKGTIEDLPVKDIKNQIQINFISAIALIQGVLPLMRQQKKGQIINIGSIGAYTKTPTFGYYAITKNMLLMSSEILREEIRSWNIKVSILIPGAIKSNFGKNIINFRSQSPYSNLYSEWNNRFENYFTKHNSADQIANQLWELIEKPQDTMVCSSREGWIIFWHKIFNNKINRYLLSKFIYKERL